MLGTLAPGRIARAVLVAATLAACSSTRPGRLVASEIVLDGDGGPLPVRWVGTLAFADVSIDGHPPRPFLLDTGASVLIVSERLASDLALPRLGIDAAGGTMPLRAAQGTTAQVREAVAVTEARAGPLALRGIDGLVHDTALLSSALGAPVDGVLPAGVLRGLLVTWDATTRTVTAHRGAIPPDAPDAIDLTREDLPTVTLDLGGVPFAALLDTGSMEFLSVPESAVSGATFRSPAVQTGMFATAGGAVPRREGRLAGTIALGPHRIADPVVALNPSDRGGIGMDLLQHFRLTIDHSRRRARFERASTDPLLTPPVRGIGAGFSRGGGASSVAYVLAGSPADRAGLRVGDRVETIEGVPAAQMDAALLAILFTTSGAVRLGVADPQGGPRREVTVEVATMVE